jgi:hypothetical protein
MDGTKEQLEFRSAFEEIESLEDVPESEQSAGLSSDGCVRDWNAAETLLPELVNHTGNEEQLRNVAGLIGIAYSRVSCGEDLDATRRTLIVEAAKSGRLDMLLFVIRSLNEQGTHSRISW